MPLCCGLPRGGKIPRPYIADCLDQYHIAFKKVFYMLKGIRSIHIRDIHIRNINKRERLNGEVACRFKPARGISKEASLIFRIAVLHPATRRHGWQDTRQGRRH